MRGFILIRIIDDNVIHNDIYIGSGAGSKKEKRMVSACGVSCYGKGKQTAEDF